MSQILVNAYCTRRELPPRMFPHKTVGMKTQKSPALAPHLAEIIQWVATRGEAGITLVNYLVMRHLERVRHHVILEVGEEHLDTVGEWALESNALLVFADTTVRDPRGGVLVYPDGRAPDEQARLPYPRDAWERKERTDEILKARGIEVSPNPPVISELEVVFRTPEEVEARALALAAVARRGKGGPKEDVSGLALTPVETTFLSFDEVDPDEAFEASWRTESQFLLEWALGMRPELPWPGEVAALDGPSQGGGDLRPAAEILDQLDLHHRLLWAGRQAAQEERDPPEGIHGSVVMERYYALNWLVRFENAEWDDVDMPT